MTHRPVAGNVPTSLTNVAARVEERMRILLDAEVVRWSAIDPDLAEPLASLRALVLAGGKRLRPAFCHWAYVGAGGDAGDEAVVAAGAALELLHTFALVHDDVMDDSSRRRGLETIHLDFAGRHHEGAWRGEGRRFGEGVAILVGDLAFVYADVMLRGAPAAAIDVFNELRLEVNIGQYLDLLGTVRGKPSVDAARRICQYKSGKYTVERPLHLGAALAGRLEELRDGLSAYGLPLGEAFQLRDDLLGAFGDAKVLGKSVGDDLREGKPTALLALARDRAEGVDAALLDDRIGAADLSPLEVADLQGVMERSGARREVEERVDALTKEAVGALADLDITAEAKDELEDLAWFIAGRDH